MNDDAAEVAVCRVLAGTLRPGQLPPHLLEDAWACATFTSVDELVAEIVCADDRVDPRMRERAQARLREAAAREAVRFRGLRLLVEALAGQRALLMKGAGLAYTVYASPHLRPSQDVDVLVDRASVGSADRALVGAGFQRLVEPDSELASMQRHYARSDGPAVEHVVDLHWAAANRHVFADVLPFEEVWAASRPVPLLGDARTLGPVDALLLACVHRVAHHDDHPSLLWLWDVHVLALALTPEAWVALCRRAGDVRMSAVVAHGLRLAQERFGTRVDAGVLERLGHARGEPSAGFIGGRHRPVDLLHSDLAAAGSLRRRVQLLTEHLFPSTAYIRARYASWPRVLLPLAYVHRIAAGAPKWLRRPTPTMRPR